MYLKSSNCWEFAPLDFKTCCGKSDVHQNLIHDKDKIFISVGKDGLVNTQY